MITVKIQPVDPNKFFHIPQYASEFSAGRDIKACLDEPMIINSQQSVLVPTNLRVEFPPKFYREKEISGIDFGEIVTRKVPSGFHLELQIRAKSGLSYKKQLIVTNGIGTIDADYRGELMVSLTNVGCNPVSINPEESIAQLVLAPIIRYDVIASDEKFSKTERDEKGFGEMSEVEKQQRMRIDKHYLVNMQLYFSLTRMGFCCNCGEIDASFVPEKNRKVPEIADPGYDTYVCDRCNKKHYLPAGFDENIPSLNLIKVGYLNFKPVYPTKHQIDFLIKDRNLSEELIDMIRFPAKHTITSPGTNPKLSFSIPRNATEEANSFWKIDLKDIPDEDKRYIYCSFCGKLIQNSEYTEGVLEDIVHKHNCKSCGMQNSIIFLPYHLKSFNKPSFEEEVKEFLENDNSERDYVNTWVKQNKE